MSDDRIEIKSSDVGWLKVVDNPTDFLLIDVPSWDGGWRLHINPPGAVRRWILARFGIAFKKQEVKL